MLRHLFQGRGLFEFIHKGLTSFNTKPTSNNIPIVYLEKLFGNHAMIDSADTVLLEFYYFYLRDGERWLMETRFSRPWYFEATPKGGMSGIRKRVALALSVFGCNLQHRRITISSSGTSVYCKLSRTFENLGACLKGKSIVVFAKAGRKEIFVKIPLTDHAAAGLDIEQQALTELRADPDLQPLLPASGTCFGYLAVANVKGSKSGQPAFSEILRIHDLLYQRSKISIPIHELEEKCCQTPIGEFSFAPRGLTRLPQEMVHIIKQTRQTANAYLDSFPEAWTVDCYMAHGDFLPQNIILAADKSPRIIDWEFFGLKPRYYDVFHYLIWADVREISWSPETTMQKLKSFETKMLTTIADKYVYYEYIGFYFTVLALTISKSLELYAVFRQSDLRLLLKLCDVIRFCHKQKFL